MSRPPILLAAFVLGVLLAGCRQPRKPPTLADERPEVSIPVEVARLEEPEVAAQLDAFADVNAIDADEVLRAQLLLARLADQGKCTETQRRIGLRFLSSSVDEVFSHAALLLAACADRDTEEALRRHANTGSSFHRVWAASVLLKRGREDEFSGLVAAAADGETPRNERRELLRRLIFVETRKLIPTYIALLRDPDPWIRYAALGPLREISNRRFGHWHSNGLDEETIRRWQAWFRDEGQNVPDRWSPRPSTIGGIGAELSQTADGIRVVRVFPGGSAAQSGVRAGDRLISIDGESVDEKPMVELVQYELRGPIGSVVEIDFARQESPNVTRRALERRPLVVLPRGENHRRWHIPHGVERSREK